MAKGWPKGKPRHPKQEEEPAKELCGNCARLLYRDPIGRGICELSRNPKDSHDEKCSSFGAGKDRQGVKSTTPNPEPPRRELIREKSTPPQNQMKIYISGKISGLPADEVEAKFGQAAQQIQAFGHQAVSPLDNGLHTSEHWNKHIIADIALLLECNAIYLLHDWTDSKGARIEANIAQECGLEVIPQPAFAILRK